MAELPERVWIAPGSERAGMMVAYRDGQYIDNLLDAREYLRADLATQKLATLRAKIEERIAEERRGIEDEQGRPYPVTSQRQGRLAGLLEVLALLND